MTNSDGRCLDLLPSWGSEEATKNKSDLAAGQIYKIVFKTKEYFEHTNRKSFYPWVEVGPNAAFTRLRKATQRFFHIDHLRHRKPRRPLSYPTVNQSLCLQHLQR